MANLFIPLVLIPFLFEFAHPFDIFNPFENIFQIAAYPNVNQNAPFQTVFAGRWELVSNSSGVVGMHMQLLPNGKVVMFDATNVGDSRINLPRRVPCRDVPPQKGDPVGKTKKDCQAHAIEFNPNTGAITPLNLLTNAWCSSGGLSVEGTLVSSGGWADGGRSMRYIKGCHKCDWKEYRDSLSGQRWYSTQTTLADGSMIIIGGRRMWNYEFIPREGAINKGNIYLPLLDKTTDPKDENNLYPFVNLMPDGNLFIFANNRSILLNPKTNQVVRELPPLPGGARNYPASGMSALLPITLLGQNPKNIPAEVIVCGGAKHEAFGLAEAKNKVFLPALNDCARLTITDPKAQWQVEMMPGGRVMSDMLILPNGQLLMINGAKKGTSAWYDGEDPSFNPFLYDPKSANGQRFKTLTGSTIPRMYHSTSAVLPDGRILVTGSNPNARYVFNVKYPTELRLEMFYPPYLDPALDIHRPQIVPQWTKNQLKYGERFTLQFTLKETGKGMADIKVSMYRPPFTTHGYSMDQRMLFLAQDSIREGGLVGGSYALDVFAPPNGSVAPPGYYLLFVIHRGVPSPGMWVRIQL